MKNLLLAAFASLALLSGASSAQAQDRGQRGPQSNYGNNDRSWDNNNSPRTGAARSYNNGRHNGHRRMSHADAMRMRRYQYHRRQQSSGNWAYQQGARDGRRQSYRNSRGGCR